MKCFNPNPQVLPYLTRDDRESLTWVLVRLRLLNRPRNRGDLDPNALQVVPELAARADQRGLRLFAAFAVQQQPARRVRQPCLRQNKQELFCQTP